METVVTARVGRFRWTICAPPPTMPVTDSTSRPGVSITVRPGLVIGAE